MKAAWIAAAAGFVTMGCGVYVHGADAPPEPGSTETPPQTNGGGSAGPETSSPPSSPSLPGTNEESPGSTETPDVKPVLRMVSEGEADAPVNLTTDGKLDWVHWRPAQYGAFTRKKDAVAIATDVALLSGASVSYYTMSASITTPRVRFSWTDGQPTTASNDDHYALYGGDVGSGVSVKIDATNHAIATIYASAVDASARLTASLSDESASPITSKIVQGSTTGFNGKFVIELKGATKGATVTIKWLMESELVGGKLALAAISLE